LQLGGENRRISDRYWAVATFNYQAAQRRIQEIARAREEARRKRQEARRKRASRHPLQDLWDRNGAAIYAANQKFKEAYGKDMSASARKKAIKDATVNGHFNAGAYAGNLVKAATPPPPPKKEDPHAGIGDWVDRQDKTNAKMLDEASELKKWSALQKQKNAPVDSATASYMAMGAAAEAGEFTKEDYDEARKQAENNALQRGLRAYYEGRKDGEDDYLNNRYDFWDFTRVSDIPKPVRVLTETEEILVKTLGVTTVLSDILVTRLSLGGAFLEVGLGSIDGPAPLGDLTGIATYELYVNPLENILSAVAFGATALSDILQGNTYIDASNNQKVIGQDTLVSGAGILVGNQPFLPLEGFLDSAVNIPILYYDARGLAGNPVLFDEHTWELRIDSQDHEAYFLGYAE